VAEPSSGPLDEEVLRTIQSRLERDDRFERVEFDPSPDRVRTVVAHYTPTLYPEAVDEARIDVRWHVGGDYSVHYVERRADGDRWECRWDRHPEDAGRRHVHPPPDAGSPEPADLPTDYRDVLATVLAFVGERIEALWGSSAET
jgi:hypothetical protein